MALKINSTSDVEIERIVGLVVGQSGIGKTFLVSTLEGKTLVASAEGGLLCLKKLPKEVRANIDFAVYHAKTTYGTIGVKVWIYNRSEE